MKSIARQPCGVFKYIFIIRKLPEEREYKVIKPFILCTIFCLWLCSKSMLIVKIMTINIYTPPPGGGFMAFTKCFVGDLYT